MSNAVEEVCREEFKPITFELTEDFLFNNFIHPFTKQSLKEDEEPQNIAIDPSKLDFCETIYDRHYYKEKFPLLDDEVCEILEKCSIDKAKKHEKSNIADDPKTKEKQSGVHFEKKNITIEFN